MASELEECEWCCADLLITDSEKDKYVSANSMYELCDSITKKDAAMLRDMLTEYFERSVPSSPLLLSFECLSFECFEWGVQCA